MPEQPNNVASPSPTRMTWRRGLTPRETMPRLVTSHRKGIRGEEGGLAKSKVSFNAWTRCNCSVAHLQTARDGHRELDLDGYANHNTTIDHQTPPPD